MFVAAPMLILFMLLLIVVPLCGWHLFAWLAEILANPLAFVVHDTIMILAALLAYHVIKAAFDAWLARRMATAKPAP